jgi:hypothetical protein
MPEMSSQPAVPPTRPALAGSMFHVHVALTSSQLMGSPSDHCMPDLSFQVTLMPASLRTTPPLSTVGTSWARSGA